MKWFLDVLRGMVIGLANVIPGVSGGTMMVSTRSLGTSCFMTLISSFIARSPAAIIQADAPITAAHRKRTM